MRKIVCQAQCCAIVKKNALEVQSFLRARCQVELARSGSRGARCRCARNARVLEGVRVARRGQRDRGTGDVCACRRVTARAASCRVRASAPKTRLALRYDSIAPARSCDDSSSARALDVRARAENRRRHRPSRQPRGRRAMSARSVSARARCTLARRKSATGSPGRKASARSSCCSASSSAPRSYARQPASESA